MFINNASDIASIQYWEYGNKRDRIVLKNSSYRMHYILRTTVIPNYLITANKQYTTQQYYLNGKTDYQFSPTIGMKGPMHILYITDARTYFSFFNCHNTSQRRPIHANFVCQELFCCVFSIKSERFYIIFYTLINIFYTSLMHVSIGLS